MFDFSQQPPQGVLQGSPDGPIIWAVVSSLILNCLRREGFGAHIRSALQNETNQYLGCVFVDDATYMQKSDNHCAKEVVDSTQQTQTILEGLSKATGGALNPTKSFWWMMDFEWKHGIAKIQKDSSRYPDIRLKDKHNNHRILELKKPDTAERILGVHQAPLNDGSEQTRALRTKVNKFTNSLKRQKLPTHLAWLAIQSRAYAAIEWPLVACTLSKEQCKHIMAPLLKWGLRALGVQSNLNRSIVFGPPKLMGLGFRSLYTTMGIDKSLHMITHGSEDTMTGKLLRGTYELLVLETGLPGELFQWQYGDWEKIVKHSWISAQWKFLSEVNAHIQTNIKTPPLRRLQDQYLMPLFQRTPTIAKHLRAINRCRIFLKAITIADITSADGRKIRKTAWEGRTNEDEYLGRHDLNWQQQCKPSPTDWQHWRSAIKTLLIPLTATKYLRTPLGEWCEHERHKWKWFLDTATDTLWEKISPPLWKTFTHQGMYGRPTAGIYIFAQEVTSPGPVSAIRAEVITTLAGDKKIVSTSPCPTTQSLRYADNLLAHIQNSLTPSQQYLLNFDQIPTDECLQHIKEAIMDGNSLLVSDGSFFPETKQSAFHTILETGDR